MGARRAASARLLLWRRPLGYSRGLQAGDGRTHPFGWPTSQSRVLAMVLGAAQCPDVKPAVAVIGSPADGSDWHVQGIFLVP